MSYSTGRAENVVKTALDEVFMPNFNYAEWPGTATAETAAVFRQMRTDKAAEISEQLTGVGYWDERAGLAPIAEAAPSVGSQKTVNIVNFAKSLEIEKNLFDDDQHGTIEMLVQDFARTGRLTRDKNAFAVFRNGFTTELTNDGQPLFDTAHVIKGGTVSNLGTAALAESSLNDGIVALRTQKTVDATLGGHAPAVLLVPTAKHKTACEITKSELRSGTANNDMNYYSQIFPGLMVMTSPFLDAAEGGSDDAWFLLSANHKIVRYIRQDIVTDLVPYQYQSNNAYIYKAEYREQVAAISWEGAWASDGSV